MIVFILIPSVIYDTDNIFRSYVQIKHQVGNDKWLVYNHNYYGEKNLKPQSWFNFVNSYETIQNLLFGFFFFGCCLELQSTITGKSWWEPEAVWYVASITKVRENKYIQDAVQLAFCTLLQSKTQTKEVISSTVGWVSHTG